jgi:NADPH:quinone reductase-like Zn-dependent oxidoreductase
VRKSFATVIPNSFLVSVLVIFASPLSVFGVRRITDLDGADIVIDAIGGEILSEALSTLAAGGRLRS